MTKKKLSVHKSLPKMIRLHRINPVFFSNAIYLILNSNIKDEKKILSWIKYISLNIQNERVQSVERVFILYSGQRTFNKKKLFIHVQKEKKKGRICIYSELFIQWIKCGYR
jgi:hypothetical protein